MSFPFCVFIKAQLNVYKGLMTSSVITHYYRLCDLAYRRLGSMYNVHGSMHGGWTPRKQAGTPCAGSFPSAWVKCKHKLSIVLEIFFPKILRRGQNS